MTFNRLFPTETLSKKTRVIVVLKISVKRADLQQMVRRFCGSAKSACSKKQSIRLIFQHALSRTITLTIICTEPSLYSLAELYVAGYYVSRVLGSGPTSLLKMVQYEKNSASDPAEILLAFSSAADGGCIGGRVGVRNVRLRVTSSSGMTQLELPVKVRRVPEHKRWFHTGGFTVGVSGEGHRGSTAAVVSKPVPNQP